MKAKFLSLNVRDFLKGLITAIIIGVLTFLQGALLNGDSLDKVLLGRMGISAIIAFLGYLLKNLFTNSKDEFLTPEK